MRKQSNVPALKQNKRENDVDYYFVFFLLGSYVYLEVSSPIKQGDTAILMSQQFNSVGGNTRCLNFWYHMFGADIGTLQVVYKVFSGSQPETLIWNLTGQQHNSETSPWKPGRVPISMDADHVVS